MKKFYTILAGLVLAAGSIFLFNFLGGVSQAALPEDCDNNSIIYCGGTTASTLASRYKANKTGDLPAIYNAYGLSATDMTNAGTRAKMGSVTKDGRVIVGGKTVATGAKSIGRHNMSGSTKKTINGKTYYERSTSVSFRSSSIAAYVFFDANGDFRAAVLTSCANPVTAKKPVYKCENLAAKAISRTKYTFTATASASNGATITGYTFDFGDGTKKTTTSKTIDHEYAKAGSYTVKLSVNVKVNGVAKTVTAAACQKTIKCENPPATYVCNSLAASKISRTEYAFTGKATVTGDASIVNYIINYGDGKTETLPSLSNVKHVYAKAGSYTATLTVTVKVNGANKTITADSCKTTIKVEENPTYACESLTATKISRTEYSFTGKASAANGATIVNYVINYGDGKSETLNSVTGVKHAYATPGSYTAKLTVNVKVGNETKAVTDAKCSVPVKVEDIPVTPTYVCDSLTASKISRTEYAFTGKATVTGGATIVNYVLDYGDGKTETLNSVTGVKHVYAEAKEYTAKLTVNVKVGNETKAITGANCTVKVTVAPEECKPGIPVGDDRCKEECKPGIPVGDDRCKEECKPGVPVGHKDCEEVEECKPGIPVGDDRCKEECKPGIPVGDDRCVEECKPGVPVGDENCEETPVELPKTGAAQNLLTLLGAGSLIAAAGYYIASRRALP